MPELCSDKAPEGVDAVGLTVRNSLVNTGGDWVYMPTCGCWVDPGVCVCAPRDQK